MEFGIILWPEAVLELLKIHNASYVPLDAKIVSFSINALDGMFTIDFATSEDIGAGNLAVKAIGDRLKVN